MADHYFKRVQLEASSGNFIRIFPDDKPDTLRNVFFGNSSGSAVSIRDSVDTNMSFFIESTTALDAFGMLLDTSRLEARSLTTNAPTISVIGSPSRSNF
jgi:hypothetical protein